MSITGEGMARGVRRVLLTQLVLTLLAAAGFLLLGVWRTGQPGMAGATAALYGGGVTVIGSWWLGRRVQQASELARTNPTRSQIVLYAGAVQRFLGALVLLGVGLAALKLAPIPLIVGFAVAQFGFLVNVDAPTGAPKR